jgi:serine/threonine protein phosphatase 1
MRAYAIGDIHGHLDKLVAAHALIARDRDLTGDGAAPVIHVGDLVDRGPDSRGVIDFLAEGLARGENWVVLKGNHDRMFAGFLAESGHQDAGLRAALSWLHPNLGGAETLRSYGVKNAGDRPVAGVWDDARALVPEAHLRFMAGLPTLHRRGEVAYVHAGIRPGVPLEAQDENDLVWIREPFLSDPRDHGVLVVHGHTVVDSARHYGNRLNIDSGAGYGRSLTTVVVEGREAFVITDAGRVALPVFP